MGFQHGSNSVVTRWTVLKGWRSEFTVGPSHVFLMFLVELVEHRSKFKRKYCVLRFPGLPARCTK